LIGLKKPKSVFHTEIIVELENKLKELKHRYFRPSDRATKLRYRKKDKELRKQLLDELTKNHYSIEDSERIANFDMFDQNASADWFDPEWMFGLVDGFDIVIGNPPYVRQENISDKEIIVNSITKFFVDEEGNSLIKINKRSDLYVYFYYRGLSLLKSDGIFCFINSSSWLDVDYGTELQQFLLKYMKPLMIVDNVAERSFDADINTIIVLIQKTKGRISNDDLIKFVVFKKTFSKILNSDILKQIHKAKNKIINEDFRLITKSRKELWIEGIETEGNEIKENKLWDYKYIGNKWGGKYLRAPEIFFKILEKGKGKLVKLGDIEDIKFGIKTGANEFFYLEPIEKSSNGLLYVKNSAGWEGYIEEEFLKPVIKSPRELKTIVVKEEDLKYRVFMCHKSKYELKGTYALEYIKWGEKKGYHKRPTCASRQRWWDLGNPIIGDLFCMMSLNDRYIFWLNQKFHIDARLYDIYVKNDNLSLLLPFILNCSLIPLFIELGARGNLGEGALDFKVYEAKNILILKDISIRLNKNGFIDNFLNREILSIFEEFGFPKCNKRNCKHPEHPYEYVNPEEISFDRIMPDRRELDKIVFEELGLTEEEQLEVYRAVLELVKNRLLKAKSR